MEKFQTFPEHINAYMIVVEGNKASEYYYNYCKPSWEKIGLTVNRFKAITPQTVKHTGLRFEKYVQQAKYTTKNINADFTDTEKAVWCSHFTLWQECCYLNESIIVLEHDTYLEKPENLWYDPSYGMIFYDKAAMGSYLITPIIARELVEYAYSIKIWGGPYGSIQTFRHNHKIEDLIVNDQHEKYNPASNQVMSKTYGNTVDHYCNLHPEHWPADRFHKFIEIE